MNAGNTPVALTLAVLSEGGGERELSSEDRGVCARMI